MSSLTPVSFKPGRKYEPRLSQPRVSGCHHARFWTEAEKQIVREHYPTGGMAGCLARLPGRTPSGIHQTARKLDIGSERMPTERYRHAYGPEMDERIRAAWPELKGRGAVDRLAIELDVPRWWLSKRATKLGLSQPHRKEPNWTEAENALMRQVPLHNPEMAARIFRQHGYHRTATAIVVRAKRLEISRRTHETLSARDAGKVLGVDDKTVTRWCIVGDIAAGRRGSKRLSQQGGDAWAIEPASLRRFVIDHIDRIDIRKVEKFAFIALLTEPHPLATSTGETEATARTEEPIVSMPAEEVAAGPAITPASASIKRVKRGSWQPRRLRDAIRKRGIR